MAGVGEHERPGGATAAATAGADLAGLDDAVGEHGVEVAAHGGGGQPQALGQARHRDGAFLTHQAGDPRARPVDFHNTIVHLFTAARHEG